jgi:hypothetical protein
MPPLRLHFAVTHDEASQAQSLVLRQQLGGGSKWRTWLVLLVTFFGLLAALFFKIPADQRNLWIGLFVALWIATSLWIFIKKKPTPEPADVEITDQAFRLTTGGATLDYAWSAFSQLIESETLFVLLDRSKTVAITIPKRAFPDHPSQDWFRSLVHTALASTQTPTPTPPSPQSSGDLILHFRYTYLDYLDYTLAGWFARAAMLGVAALMAYAVVEATRRPVHNAVHSTTTVLLFMSPFFLLMICMPPFVFSVKYWLQVRRQITPQTVRLGDHGLVITEPAGDTHLQWSTLRHYKEARRTFILWNSHRSPALMLPKRALATSAQLNQLRALLDKHLARSTWLLG